MNRRLWPPAEVVLLRELAGTMPVGEIAAQLGRSGSGVKAKAHNLGISIRVKQLPAQSGMTLFHRRWTTAEDDQLERLLQAKEPVEAIAVQLNRTSTAVYTRACLLGMSVSPAQRLRNTKPLS